MQIPRGGEEEGEGEGRGAQAEEMQMPRPQGGSAPDVFEATVAGME